MEERQSSRQHRVVITDRAVATLNGVLDILSFDLREILLETEQGMLMIKGKDLHVNRLTLEKGELDLSGRIDSVVYSDMPDKSGASGSFFSRLFSNVEGSSGESSRGKR